MGLHAGHVERGELRQLIHRFVWDGDQVLYETSGPGATGTSAALLEADVGLPLKEQGADSALA